MCRDAIHSSAAAGDDAHAKQQAYRNRTHGTDGSEAIIRKNEAGGKLAKLGTSVEPTCATCDNSIWPTPLPYDRSPTARSRTRSGVPFAPPAIALPEACKLRLRYGRGARR